MQPCQPMIPGASYRYKLAILLLLSLAWSEGFGLTSSEQEVLDAWLTLCGEGGAQPVGETTYDLTAVCSMSVSDREAAARQVTPKQTPAQGTSSMEISQRQFDNITARMEALRSGVSGISLSGLTLEQQGQRLSLGELTKTASGGSAGEEAGALVGRLGFFINGNMGLGEKDGSSNELGFDFDTRGLTAGMDYRFTDQFIVGAAVGYVNNQTDFDVSRGEMDVDGTTLALYTTYYHDEASYLDAIISYGWNDFDNTRQMSFDLAGTPISAQTSGSTDGEELSISLGGGYDFNRGSLSYGPYARLNYISADIDAYTETSSVGFEMGYGDQEVESLTSLLGGQLGYAISTSSGVFMPQARLEWVHEFNNDSRFIDGRFVYIDPQPTFSVATDDPDRNYFNLGLGVSATFGAGKSGYLYYETLLGQQDIQRHALAAGVRFEF